MIILIALFLLLGSHPAIALDADYTSFIVDGHEYNVPIPNRDTRNDFYMLHKALAGDMDARKLLLGGQPKREIFIGDEFAVRWLVLTETDESIIEYKIGE